MGIYIYIQHNCTKHACVIQCLDPAHPATIQRPSNERPSQFCFAVRRSEQHGPEGTVSIEEESYGEGGGSAEDGSPGFPSSKGWKFLRYCENIHGLWEALIFDVMNFPRFFPEVCLFHPCPPTEELGATRNSEYWWIMMNIVFFKTVWTGKIWLAMWLCVWLFSPQNLEERELCMTLRFPKPGDYSS